MDIKYLTHKLQVNLHNESEKHSYLDNQRDLL